jgi:hypothetical protein
LIRIKQQKTCTIQQVKKENVRSDVFPITGIFGAACARKGTMFKLLDMETGEGYSLLSIAMQMQIY